MSFLDNFIGVKNIKKGSLLMCGAFFVLYLVNILFSQF
ncbi:membrane protein [Chlamydia psittaci NJ1]|nr:putative membrane protein [Chlamydia psittaci M56]AFS28354.1 putative membrane protein [Chlamydia psittaci NJ1]KPZ36189.1 membrane protein [Chlamydia psittaci NJ1]